MFTKSESQEVISKAKELYMRIQNRLASEKEEKRLKDYFKENFPHGVIADKILITCEECSRENLNKKQLVLDFGEEKIHEYLTETSFVKVEVKQVG